MDDSRRISERESRERRVRAVAARQRGHITRDQLLDAGLDKDAIRRRVRSGRLRTRAPPSIRRAGLPPPETNARVAGHEVDAVWPQQRVVVEVDGDAFHHTRRAFERDRIKTAVLQAAGCLVLHLTWRQITTQGERTAATLAATLTSRR